MDKQAEENPFAQLFSSSEDLKKAEELARTQRLKYVSDVLTRIFLFTNTTGKQIMMIIDDKLIHNS